MFIDNDFERISNARCVHDEEAAFETLEEAQNECKTSKQCKGVLDTDCKGQEKYYLCSETQESNSTFDSCVYRKFIIGEDIAMYYRKDRKLNCSHSSYTDIIIFCCVLYTKTHVTEKLATGQMLFVRSFLQLGCPPVCALKA